MSNYTRGILIAAFLLILTGASTAAFYQISFRGLTLDKTAVDAGNDIGVTANVANLGEEPRTDIQIKASLVRDSDRSVVFEDVIREDVDMAGRELVLIEQDLTVPENIPSGNYSLTVMAVDSSGISKAYVSKDITVNNDRDISSISFGNQGVFLLAERVVTGDNYVRTYSLPSYGTQGENVLPGSNFTIRFDLENTGTETVSPTAEFDITPTYSNAEPVKEFEKDLGSINPQETREFSFDEEMENPGTYVINADISGSDGSDLGSSQVRLVIAGAGGSITDLANSQDTYSSGQTVSADATIVGPADGSTTVNNADLTMRVIKDNNIVLEENTNIDTLPLSPQDYTLEARTDQDLDRYVLNVTLSKGDKIFDTYTSEYQSLTAERSLTAEGQVRDRKACFDDGECTEKEFEIGSCYDCRNVSPAKFVDNRSSEGPGDTQQGPSNLPIYAGIALLVIVTAVYWRWNR